jgi:chloride channel protein, CIC family
VPASGREARFVLLVAAVTGGLTGLAVAGFERAANTGLFEHLVDQPRAVQVAAPCVGLVLAALAIRGLGGAGTATSDEYIKSFHDRRDLFDLRPVPARTLASVLTLGLGGAMGYEGPSIYLGAAIGTFLHRRLGRRLSRQDAKVLLVCGAAAGVAAIFKAPATGLVFALEVPYQDDVARDMLLPAGVAAATSYIVFASLIGTSPLIPVGGAPPFNIRDIGGALALGVICGIGARLFTTALRFAKAANARVPRWAAPLIAGAGLAGLAAAAFAVADRGLTLGAGYDTIAWALDPRRSFGLVATIVVLRAGATVLTVGGGGVGGLFVPLVVEGALIGRAFGAIVGTAAGTNFFPLIGVAAFLGAGYRVPLAGVVFVAEATGRPGFIVPGMLASIVAQLCMGNASASAYQQPTRFIGPEE